MSGFRLISIKVNDLPDEARVLISTTPSKHDLTALLQTVSALVYGATDNRLHFRIHSEEKTP